MASQDLNDVLQQEYRRLTGGSSSSEPTDLLKLINAGASTPGLSNSSEMKTTGLTPTLAAASTSSTGSAINKGYTLPSPTEPQSESDGGSSVAGDIGKTALKLFTSGLGIMPLISGLAGLFGGSQSAPPEPLVKYAMPQSIHIAAANSTDGGALSFTDYGQDGTARAFGGTSTGSTCALASPSTPRDATSTRGQIVVNVQAMDSRSFMDHSQEIAHAVREAMLSMHSLNDVVSEL